MSWVRLDDGFADHPKIVAAGPESMALYVAGLCYSCRYLTDGFVPLAQVPKLIGTQEPVARLVKQGLWEIIEGGYKIHDYHDYQPKRTDVLTKREARAEAGRRGGLKQTPKQNGSKPASKTGSKTEAKANPIPGPVPVPGPEPVPPNSSAASPRKRTQIPKDFTPTEAQISWAKENFPTVNAVAETVKFYDHHLAKGSVMKDWDAAWRNWIRRVQQFAPNGKSPTEIGRGRYRDIQASPDPGCAHSTPMCAECRAANKARVREITDRIGLVVP